MSPCEISHPFPPLESVLGVKVLDVPDGAASADWSVVYSSLVIVQKASNGPL